MPGGAQLTHHSLRSLLLLSLWLLLQGHVRTAELPQCTHCWVQTAAIQEVLPSPFSSCAAEAAPSRKRAGLQLGLPVTSLIPDMPAQSGPHPHPRQTLICVCRELQKIKNYTCLHVNIITCNLLLNGKGLLFNYLINMFIKHCI